MRDCEQLAFFECKEFFDVAGTLMYNLHGRETSCRKTQQNDVKRWYDASN